VVESFRRAADPANASQWLVRLGTALDRVEAAGNDVVAFRLRRPFAPFSTMLGRIPVLPATGRYEPQLTFARELVGTGPFLLDSWADDRVTFAAFDDHHGGRPPLDGIEFRLSADPLSDALDGRAHLAATESGFEQAQVGAAGFSLAVAERSTVRTVALANLDRNRPTSAHLARLAIATAVDRTAIVDDVLGGIGEPCTAVLAPSTPGSAELSESGIGVRPDFDAAAEAFAASRSSTARPFTIVTGDSRIAGAIAEHVARGCRELGFDASVEPLAPAVLAARLAVTDPDDPGDYDLAVVGAHTQPAGGYGPDYAYFGLRSGLPTNLNKVDDPQLDVLLDAAAVDNSVDGWREVQAYDIASGLYQIPLVAGRHAEAVAPTVIGFEASGLGTLERLGEVRLG
jgi:ABC-type transport system substrate-binding protein